MTARQLRWVLASIAIALEATAFVVWMAWMLRTRSVEHPLEAPAEVKPEEETPKV